MIETTSMHEAMGFLAAGEGGSITALSRAEMDVEPAFLTDIPMAGAARAFANLRQGA